MFPVGARELIFCLPCRLVPSRAPQGRREGSAWLALQRRAIVRAWGCVIPPPFQYCGHEGWAGVSGDFQGPPPCRSGWPKWPPSSNSTNIKKKSRSEAMVARASVRSRVPFSERFLRARPSLGPGAPLAKAQRPRRNIRDSARIRRLLFMGEKGASTGPSWGPYVSRSARPAPHVARVLG